MKNSPQNCHKAGIDAEQAVGRILENQGWKVLISNFRTRHGEIDIIAEEGQSLVFVEVKSSSRKSVLLGTKVNQTKRKKLILAATGYIQSIDVNKYEEIRFDVISVVRYHLTDWSINHIRNAFSADED